MFHQHNASVPGMVSVLFRQESPHCTPRGGQREGLVVHLPSPVECTAEEMLDSENREKETPQHVYFLCVSVVDLILYLSVEKLPCNSVVSGSRPLFFKRYNSFLCCVVIKILLFNELSCKMKLIIKKTL